MKKLLKVLISLIVIYILLKSGIKHLGNGHKISYKINDFEIKETLSINKKDEFNNYYINIKSKNIDIDIQLLNIFNKNKKILKNIKVEKIGDLVCILPIFENEKILTDILCIENNIINNYSNLKGTNNDLDSFTYRMKEYGYNSKMYENNLKNNITDKTIKVFIDNIIDDHYIVFNTYKGVRVINPSENNLNKINLFNKDIYDVSLAKGLKNKYIIFDYDAKHEFSKIYIIDFINNKTRELKLKTKIAKNSKIIGIYENNIYLVDYDNKKEYEINIKKETITEVGNKKLGYITYNCNEMEEISSKKILNKDYIMPNCNLYKNDTNYKRVDLVGGTKSGYYYYYEKHDKEYKIYRSNVQNKEQKTYIATTDDIDSIQYNKEYIFFINNNQLNYYSDKTGIRTLMENSEFEFNDALNYHIYIKES